VSLNAIRNIYKISRSYYVRVQSAKSQVYVTAVCNFCCCFFLERHFVIACSQILRRRCPCVWNPDWTSRGAVTVHGIVLDPGTPWGHVWKGASGKGSTSNCSRRTNDRRESLCLTLYCFFSDKILIIRSKIIIIVIRGCDWFKSRHVV